MSCGRLDKSTKKMRVALDDGVMAVSGELIEQLLPVSRHTLRSAADYH